MNEWKHQYSSDFAIFDVTFYMHKNIIHITHTIYSFKIPPVCIERPWHWWTNLCSSHCLLTDRELYIYAKNRWLSSVDAKLRRCVVSEQRQRASQEWSPWLHSWTFVGLWTIQIGCYLAGLVWDLNAGIWMYLAIANIIR